MAEHLDIMQIMRARAGQHGAQRSVAHNSVHYVELPTTEHGWVGSAGHRTKPGHTRAGKRSAVRAETEGAASNEAAEGIGEVAKAAVWP